MDDKFMKSGFVTLIGRPNVGKSTLMNRLIGQKIAITSSKPQTTRNRIRTVLTTEEGQIVFVDTPGIHKSKNKLGDYMVHVAEHTLEEVDVILWLVEPTNFIGAGERHIIEELKKVKIPVILVINKTDTVKKEAVYSFIDTYRQELEFAEIVPVSALKGDNTDELVRCIFQYLPRGHAFFDEDTVTDQPMRQIVAELIREKALRLLEAGTAPRTPQVYDPQRHQYASMLSREMSPLDFTKPAQDLVNQVRGLIPWPCASTDVSGTRWKVFRAHAGPETDRAPGTILSAGKEGIAVACGDGRSLVITQLQAGGGRRMSAADYLRGHPINV